jgi:hypothetical protein
MRDMPRTSAPMPWPAQAWRLSSRKPRHIPRHQRPVRVDCEYLFA